MKERQICKSAALFVRSVCWQLTASTRAGRSRRYYAPTDDAGCQFETERSIVHSRRRRRNRAALVDDAGDRFPVTNGIPRMCEPDKYSESFGLQWNRFAATQLQRQGNPQSADCFFRAIRS